MGQGNRTASRFACVAFAALSWSAVALADDDAVGPASRATVLRPERPEPLRPVPAARYGLGAGMAATGCGDRCDLIANPAYGFRTFAVWPMMDGLGIGATADLGLFPREPGPIGVGLYLGGLVEVSSSYRAASSFSFWLGFGGFRGDSGVKNPCARSSGGFLQVGLRAGTHVSKSLFASLAASAAGMPGGGACDVASAVDDRAPQAPVEGHLALVTLELAYEVSGSK